MNRKRLCLLLSAVLLLGGCSSRKSEERKPVPTLAPAAAVYAAPDGDGAIRQGETYSLYLPGISELTLVARSVEIGPAELEETVETLLKALIHAEGDSETAPLGGERPLALFGDHPIEVSGGVCTVNLASSALQLSLSDFYQNCLAVATTLCEVPEIDRVNVLVAGQSVGLDITGNLPMGTLTSHRGENLAVLWEQMEARRTPLGEDLSGTPLSALATLYYPLTDGKGMECVTQQVYFTGQTPRQLTMGLMEALTAVRKSMAGGADFPDLTAQMLHEPVISELEDGGRLITLSLREDTESRLKEARTDLACVVASIACTLMTFIPGVAAVCVRIGETPVTDLRTAAAGDITALGGLVRRRMLGPFLMTGTTVYFARGGKLCECVHPINRQAAGSPRAQLQALLDGPDEGEREEEIIATLPETVRDDDILGIAAENGTVLVNLSESFRFALQGLSPEEEMLACYSMVNTLCRNTGLQRVRFYFEGDPVETIAGSIYWAGEFLYNPGLTEKGVG